MNAQEHNKINLEKYWRYRDRLKQNFIVVSGAANKSGTNIPAMRLFLTDGVKTQLDWDDANANMSHYIGMLATEYRLLKNNGGTYNETLTELYYALASIDRLDRLSESEFRDEGDSLASDLNGWMIRDDVDQNFWDTYHSQLGFSGNDPNELFSISHRTDKHYRQSFSQDNIYHLLEALGLVRFLVDDEWVKPPGHPSLHINFQNWAKDITERCINMMYHPEKAIYKICDSYYSIEEPHIRPNPYACGFSRPSWWQWPASPAWSTMETVRYELFCNVLKSNWFIMNPINEELALEGSGSEFDLWLFYCYGLSEAGNKITETNFDMAPADNLLQEDIFFQVLYGEYMDHVGAVSGIFTETIGQAIIQAFIPGTPPGVAGEIVKSIVGNNEPNIDPYKAESLATVGKIGGDNTFWYLRDNELERYPHFLLMYAAMHEAPAIYPGSTQFNNDKLHYRNLLSTAPCQGPRSYSLFAGDDYHYDWSTPSRLVWPENRGEHSGETVEYNGLDYMLLHNLYCLVYGQDFRRLTEIEDTNVASGTYQQTAAHVVGENIISPSANVTYTAHNSVSLVNGFHAQAGSIFTANIASIPVNYADYSQLNPCDDLPVARMATSSKTKKKTMDLPVYERRVKKEPKLTLEGQESVLTAYPNPADGSLVVKLEPYPETFDNASITVTDITGVNVRRQPFNRTGEAIDLSGLPRGIYIITVTSSNGKYQSKIIVR